MTTKEAVAFVLTFHELTKYRLAMTLGAQPPSVGQWLRSTKMSKAYAAEFEKQFKIKVED